MDPGLGAGPPGGGAPPPLIHTYQEYYADTDKDPSGGDYTTVMEDFNVPLAGASRYSPAGLLTRTTAASQTDTPLAFIMLGRLPTAAPTEPGRLYLFHRLTHYAPAISVSLRVI